jgi:hypothetical protein
MRAGGVEGVLVADVDISCSPARTVRQTRIARKLSLAEAFSAQTVKSAK